MLPDPLLRQVRRLTLKAKRSAHDLLAGHYESAVRGSGLTFAEVRAYQPGDDVRHFDWNVTARTGMPHVKRFVEERERVVYLVVDVSASLFFRGQKSEVRGQENSKRHVAAEVAALLAFAASIQKDRVGLVQFTHRIEQLLPPRKGDRHARRVVHELFSFEPRGKETAIDVALAPLQRRRRAVVVLLSDFRATGWDRSVKVTARRHDLIAVVVSDHAEMELPDVGRLRLSDAERGGTLVINTSNVKVRREYADRAAHRRTETLARLRKAGADILEINTAGDHLNALVRFLRKKRGEAMIQSVDDLVAQLRPITGPEAAPPAEEMSSLWLWITIALVLFAFFAATLLRRRRRAEIPPDREALKLLDRLPVAPTLSSLAELDRLSRHYLARAYLIAAEHMTSAELLIVLPDNEATEWSAIFAQLQPGRFSRRSITTEEWGSLIQQVQPLIRVVHADLAGSVVQ